MSVKTCSKCRMSCVDLASNKSIACPQCQMPLGVRPSVQWFAVQMEAVLKANDHKGGWYGYDSAYLLKRLKEEVIELEVQINHNTREPIDLNRIIHEAVDVANYAMMIADNLSDQCPKQS